MSRRTSSGIALILHEDVGFAVGTTEKLFVTHEILNLPYLPCLPVIVR